MLDVLPAKLVFMIAMPALMLAAKVEPPLTVLAQISTCVRPQSERRTAEPAEPEHDGTNDDMGHVMRSEGESLGAIAASFAKEDGVDETSGTGEDFDGYAAGVVEYAPFERPPIGVPDPSDDRAVNEGDPAEKERHDGSDSTVFGSGTDGDGGNELRGVRAGLAVKRDIVQRRTCSARDVSSGCDEEIARTDLVDSVDDGRNLVICARDRLF